MDQELCDYGSPGIPRTSMLEVFSVSFTKTANDDRRSELYGTIHVTQGKELGDHFVSMTASLKFLNQRHQMRL